MSTHPRTDNLTASNYKDAITNSFMRLKPAYQLRNPVMFVVYIGAIITTALLPYNYYVLQTEPTWFIANISFW